MHKDIFPTHSRSHVVYKINCLNCDASHVGQTKRILNIRVVEHRNHIKRDTAQVSVITDHRLQSNHNDWNGVRVLDEEINYKKRLISEMIYRVSHFNLWTRISSKLRYLQKNGLDKS